MSNSNLDIWIAGALAAITVDFIVYPLDTLKTRIQSPHYVKPYTGLSTGRANHPILFRGLYQGVWSVVLVTIPSSGAFFTTYEGVKHLLDSDISSVSSSSTSSSSLSPNHTQHSLKGPIIHAIASTIAESVSCFILTPAEILKQNAQVFGSHRYNRNDDNTKTVNNNSITAMRTVLERLYHRPTRLWTGYTTLLARNLPFTSLQFPLFEFLRGRLISYYHYYYYSYDHYGLCASSTSSQTQVEIPNRFAGKNTHDWVPNNFNLTIKTNGSNPRTLIPPAPPQQPLLQEVGVTAVSAGFAGSIAAVITTPVDIIKTRIMLSAGGNNNNDDGINNNSNRSSISAEKKLGSLDVGKEIYQKDGIRGLFRGGVLRAGWTAIGLGLYLGAYETGRLVLQNRRRERMQKQSLQAGSD